MGTNYSIIDLGTLDGTSSQAWAINNNGQVVGDAQIASGDFRAFLFTDANNNQQVDIGEMQNLGIFGTASESRGRDINNSGQVVGFLPQSNGSTRAFIWDSANGIKELGNGSTSALSINDNAQTVGFFKVNPNFHAIRWENDQNLPLITPVNKSSWATSNNNNGDIVGYTNFFGIGINQGFLWNSKTMGTMQDSINLGSLDNASTTKALDVNNQRIVVGQSGSKAFLWTTGGGMKDLGSLGNNSQAISINDKNQVVGKSNSLAFLWSDNNNNGQSDSGEMVDLNTLLPPNSGWNLTEARDINDVGQIVGTGTVNGQTHGFLLTPISETDLLSIDTTVSSETIQLGDTVTYTFKVTNNGSIDATNVRLTSQLPQQGAIRFESASRSPVVNNINGNGFFEFDLGSLVKGESQTVTLDVTLTDPTSIPAGIVKNEATVFASENDPNQANNTDLTTTTISSVDLALKVTDSPDPIKVGENLTYTFKVTNNGSVDATNVRLTSQLPQQSAIRFESASRSPVVNNINGNGFFEFDLGSLVKGESQTVTLDVTLTDPTSIPAGIVKNEATVFASEDDPNQANNTDLTTTTISSVDLALKVTDSPDPIKVGENLTYTFEVTNNGTDEATEVTLTETLTPGVSLFSSSIPPSDNSNNILTFNLGNLATGSTQTVDVKVTPTVTGLITNTASVGCSKTDINSDNNTVQTSTSVSSTLPSSSTPVLSISDSGLAVGEDGGTMNFTVNLSAPTTEEVKVQFKTFKGDKDTATSSQEETAKDKKDYESVQDNGNNTLIIPAGKTSATFQVKIFGEPPVTDQHLDLENFARDTAYHTNWKKGDDIDEGRVVDWGYRVNEIFGDPTDFYAVGLTSDETFKVELSNATNATITDGEGLGTIQHLNKPPVLAIRGTEPSEALTLYDDTNPNGIGYRQFTQNKTSVETWLNKVSNPTEVGKKPVKPSITAHSLGGALAQWFTANYKGSLGEVVTFNSPGITSPTGYSGNAEKITHYITAGDIVSMAGLSYLPGSYTLSSYKAGFLTPLPVGLNNKHSVPVIAPSIFGGQSQPDNLSKKSELSTDWLSNPFFGYHQDPDYFAFRFAVDKLVPYIGSYVAATLNFRGTTEANRVIIGSVLDKVLTVSYETDALVNASLTAAKSWGKDVWDKISKFSLQTLNVIERSDGVASTTNSNSIGTTVSSNTSLETGTLSPALQEVLKLAQSQLKDFTNASDFDTKIDLAFGEKGKTPDCRNVIQKWIDENFNDIATIKIAPASEIYGANGAFSPGYDTIYLSQEFLTQNQNNIQAIANVLLEEIGHSIDWQINGLNDSPGDEGEIFATLVQNLPLDDTKLQTLKAEDDISSLDLSQLENQPAPTEARNFWEAVPHWSEEAWNATTQWSEEAWNVMTKWSADNWAQTTKWTAEDWYKTAKWTVEDWYATLKQPQTPVDQPQTPVDQPQTPVDQPQTPVDQPQTPVDQPQTPVEQPQTPVDQPQTPVDQPQTPVDQPQTPVDQPQTPVDQPQTPVDQPQTPVDQPQTPVDQPQTPVDQPQTPVDQPQTPVDQPQTPVDQPQTPVDQPQTTVDQPQTTVDPVAKVDLYEPTNFIPTITRPLTPFNTAANVSSGNSSSEGTLGADVLIGDAMDDRILALAGDDLVNGGDGNDWISANQGNDTVDAGNGNDTVHAGKGNDVVFGSDGEDWLNGNQGNDFVGGGNSNDTIYGGQDNDTLFGEDGDDWLNGNQGDDFVDGGEGNDQAYGGQGNDTLTGGNGNDTLFSNIGNDLIEGNNGNDLIYGGQNNDTISGNEGDDTLYGDFGNDLLTANAGNDFLYGGEGDDTLFGGEDDDVLIGGPGNDLLIGAEGNDTLTGNQGSDQFLLRSGGGSDLITDFTIGEDLIVLDGGLTFTQLSIVDNNGSALIQFGQELLATIENVNASLITAGDFANLFYSNPQGG